MIDYLTKLANELVDGVERLSPLPRGDEFRMQFRGKVIGKQRPRKGGNGVFYTPKETREFEAKVKGKARWIMEQEKLKLFRSAVAVHIQFYDKMPKDAEDWLKQLAKHRLLFSEEGADMDNKEKAILDALNNVVYNDDRQVVQVYKVRSYVEDAADVGFDLSIAQVGLTKSAVENLRRLVNANRERRDRNGN